MDARKTEIREILEANNAKTHALLTSLTAADLEKTAANGWMVAQLAGHVASSPGGAVWLIGRLRKGRSANVPAFLSFIPPLRNWLTVRKLKHTTPDALVQLAADSHAKLLACVDTLADDEFDRGGVIFGIGHQTVHEFLLHGVADHAEGHRHEIRAALGTPAPAS